MNEKIMQAQAELETAQKNFNGAWEDYLREMMLAELPHLRTIFVRLYGRDWTLTGEKALTRGGLEFLLTDPKGENLAPAGATLDQMLYFRRVVQEIGLKNLGWWVAGYREFTFTVA